MKDIETGEKITLDTYVLIIDGNGERVSMNHNTFIYEIDSNRDYFNTISEEMSLEEFCENHLLCTYEVRNIFTDEIEKGGDGKEVVYPFLYLPKKAEGFKKTLEHFAIKEKISIN